jgi:hypothetical protein
MRTLATLAIALAGLLAGPLAAPAADLKPEEAREIARDAYVYGFPVVDNYRILYAYAIDSANPEYKAPWNTLQNTARVYTPEDQAIQTPNSDTPYSFVSFDLRREPIVFTIPKIDEGRYFSVQLIDAYTHNFDYIGSRSTGNQGGHYLLTGPGWKGEVPKGIDRVYRSETEIGLVPFRTQLKSPEDLDAVKAIQAGYRIQALSAFLGTEPPPAPPAIDYPKPLTPEQQKSSPEFFDLLNFVLGFCPTHPSESALFERFARLSIGAGQDFDFESLSPELKAAVTAGMADAWGVLQGVVAEANAGRVSSGDLFGTREAMKNNYAYRFAGAVLGIYGNSAAEALYPMYRNDSEGKPLDGAKARYTLRFAPGELPPVNAFWSATLYLLPQSLLYANPLQRYLINSPMLPKLKLDEDGGLTLYIQHESPGPELESNWLPAPDGPFWIALRLYWPKPEALEGRWKQPPMSASAR